MEEEPTSMEKDGTEGDADTNLDITENMNDETSHKPDPSQSIDTTNEKDGNTTDGEGDNDDDEEEEVTQPEAKFAVGQMVYARDEDSGLLYEATVRRNLYGKSSQAQLRVHEIDIDSYGGDSDKIKEDFDELLQSSPEAGWFYFVHYKGWAPKWDRWVSETSMFEWSDGSRDLAKRLQQALKDAKKSLRKKTGKSKVNGIQLHKELKVKMREMERERRAEERKEELAKLGKDMAAAEEKEKNVQEEEDTSATAKKKKWNKKTIENEVSLRQRELEGKRQQSCADKVLLPFTLKKVLVEDWEVISQCKMVYNLPARVTVRQALDKYLTSKLEIYEPSKGTENNVEKETGESDAGGSSSNGENTRTKAADHQKDESKKSEDDTIKEDEAVEEKKKEWIDMVDGIAQLFDEALPFRLLYIPELGQRYVLESDATSELSTRRKSEIYGCEHLLRFFIKLPMILAGKLTDAQQRPIFGKINDLMRFLQKNQSTLFSQQICRPLTDDEIRASDRMKKRQQKLLIVNVTNKAGDNAGELLQRTQITQLGNDEEITQQQENERVVQEKKSHPRGGKGGRKRKRKITEKSVVVALEG